MNQIPRPEHPNPQFYRENWQNLNGRWEFEIDNSNSGKARKLNEASKLSGEIIVPFCPESDLSGVGHKDFMSAVWYRRNVEISAKQLEGDVLLHFGAVDYLCEVYVNGVSAGTHQGGYSSFSFSIGHLLKEGVNSITVYAFDDTRSGMIPSGKQSELYGSHGCMYTRTTGIWQTVWMEFVPKTRIKSVKMTPNAEEATVYVEADVQGAATLKAECFFEGKKVGEREVKLEGGLSGFEISLSEKHLWEVGCGRLYDVVFTYGEDKVTSYFGLRSIRFDGMKFILNGKSVFQRLVLDQGFYPDGIYTAPSEEALVRDIHLSMEIGFNGARLHEKVFEPRFLYHCDKEGYLVWGEYPNWGLDHSRAEAVYPALFEWLEVVKRDYNHPSIIGWCPFNETWDQHGCVQDNRVLEAIYEATKAADATRPCIDTSGNYHTRTTDIYCIHDYCQNPEDFKTNYDKLMTEGKLHDWLGNRQTYKGEPTFLSEYGGIRWAPDQEEGWGYGDAPKTLDEFKARFEGLTKVLMENDQMFGLCYTQLYDVEQEVNGLYTYHREPKFDMAWVKEILTRKAAIED